MIISSTYFANSTEQHKNASKVVIGRGAGKANCRAIGASPAHEVAAKRRQTQHETQKSQRSRIAEGFAQVAFDLCVWRKIDLFEELRRYGDAPCCADSLQRVTCFQSGSEVFMAVSYNIDQHGI